MSLLENDRPKVCIKPQRSENLALVCDGTDLGQLPGASLCIVGSVNGVTNIPMTFGIERFPTLH